MNKVIGKPEDPKVERIQTGHYKVRWGYSENINGETEYYELDFPYKPSLEVIKDVILTAENQMIDQKILSGFVWSGMSVWLSSENQFNYKAAYDLAIQTSGANLPLTFKFGSSEEPVYHEFVDIQELSDFYIQAMSHVNNTLKEGWLEKDSINWENYE